MTTANKSLAQPANGSSSWDTPLNSNFGVIDAALGTLTYINVTSVGSTPVTLTDTQYQKMGIVFTGTPSANLTYNFPASVGGNWIIMDSTTGGSSYSITLGSLGAGAQLIVPRGSRSTVFCDTASVLFSVVPPGSTTQVIYNSSGAFAASASLTFDGTSLSSGNYYINSTTNASTIGYSNNSANLYMYNATGAGGTTNTVAINCNGVNRAKFDSSSNIYLNGNVGIGTTSPAAKLQVVGGSVLIDNAAAYYGKSSSGSALTVSYIDGSNNLVIGDGGLAGNISFYNNGINSLVIDTDGNACVGVGSQVGGGFNSGVAARGFFTRSGYSGGLNGTLFNIEWTGTVANLWINSTNVGQIYTSSDRRIKKNIYSQTSPALSRIMALRPVVYEMDDVGIFKADGIQREGFIADELQPIIPSSVSGGKDATDKDGNVVPQSLIWAPIMSVAVKAIQEMKAEIDKLRAELAALKGAK